MVPSATNSVAVTMPHYFDPAPAAPSRPRLVHLGLSDFEADLAVDRGVFSSTGIDPGTLELLRAGSSFPPVASGDVLDLGCGYGAIAVTVAHRNPAATVWAVDINERALQLARTNADTLGLGERIRVSSPDDVPAEVAFSQIWSNPPIRVGKAALHEMLAAWLPRLAPDGSAWLVVQRHLGADSLAAWLAGTEGGGFSVARRASKQGYRLLEVSR
jgi:16S rRNA (guanine1207-N2)-methyltransferase